MKQELFRKKTIDQLSSPEELTDYIRVSSPAMWMILGGIIALLLGACVWGIFGRLDTTLQTAAVSSGEGFSDVADDIWYTDAVLWGKATGISTGYGGGLFGPDDPVTREQMCAMLVRWLDYMGYELPAVNDAKTFTDANRFSSWARESIAQAQICGLINGVPGGATGSHKLRPLKLPEAGSGGVSLSGAGNGGSPKGRHSLPGPQRRQRRSGCHVPAGRDRLL